MPRFLISHDERFFQSYREEPNTSCWLWLGPFDAYGYGVFEMERRKYKAHRVAYEKHVGPIPEGLHIDHLCRVRSCVNPAHLEPVTLEENIYRGRAGRHWAERAACKQGHTYTVANTRWARAATGRKAWYRICRTCLRETMRSHRRRKRSNFSGSASLR